MNEFFIKQGDDAPSLRLYVRNADGSPFNLSGYSLPRFLMRLPGVSTPKVSSLAEIEDAPNGVLRYDWESVDTNVAGTFNAEFEVSSAGGKRTFPSEDCVVVQILMSLG